MPQRLVVILVCLIFQGCVIIDTGVTNPMPGMSRVAVVPFLNLTDKPNEVVDGRRFAMAYSSELQKVPGFEVIPVGVLELAMRDTGLKPRNPDDLKKLTELLGVDVFVVGEVNEYDPFYPPRIGLSYKWISAKGQMSSPGVQTDPAARRRLNDSVENQEIREESVKKTLRSQNRQQFRLPVTIRGQSGGRFEPRVNANMGASLGSWQQSGAIGNPSLGSWQRDNNLAAYAKTPPPPRTATRNRPPSLTAASPSEFPSLSPALFDQTPPAGASETPPDPTIVPPIPADASGGANTPGQLPKTPPPPGIMGNKTAPETVQPMLKLPLMTPLQSPAAAPRMWPATVSYVEPLMAYTRIFDGSDSALVAELRDYAELSAELRVGGWEGYLQRSEDFIRFACHQMIKEMLTLHGGEARRRIVLKFRKIR